MRIYVAGKDAQSAESLMVNLRSAGHEITFDWTSIPTKEAAKKFSSDMKLGVITADLLILDGVQEGMIGAFIETGIAVGLDKPVMVLNRYQNSSSVFWELGQVRVVSTTTELFSYMQDLTLVWKELNG